MKRSFYFFSIFISSNLAFAAGSNTGGVESISCNMAVTRALAGDMAAGPIPLVADMNGRLTVADQERLVSREVKGDTENIVYLESQFVELKDGKPVFRDVRKNATIKRENGRIVSILRSAGDLKQQAALREEAMKDFGVNGYKLTKSMEVRFKPKGERGCQVDQKLLVTSEDAQGNKTEQVVTYDAAFCERIKPMIDRIGLNNVSECGSLLTAAEGAMIVRRNELSGEKKKFVPGFTEIPSVPSSGVISLSSAVMGCISEMQSGYPSFGYGGYGYGGIGSIYHPGSGGVYGGGNGGAIPANRADGGAIMGGPVPVNSGKNQKGTR